MSDAPYVPFYTSDFLAGTSGMTSSTKGVYITLLCLMYEAEGPLAQKWDTLARRCGCTLPSFKRAISELQDDGKVGDTDAGLWSEKCDKHITQRRERSDSARSAAKTRWGKTERKQQTADAGASIPQCQPEPEPHKSKGANAPCGVGRFQEFWDAYPHRAKRKRADAAKKYARAVKAGVSEQTLIEAARRHHGDRSVIDGYARDAVTWLNQKGWEDEPEQPQLRVIRGPESVAADERFNSTLEQIAAVARSR